MKQNIRNATGHKKAKVIRVYDKDLFLYLRLLKKEHKFKKIEDSIKYLAYHHAKASNNDDNEKKISE